MMIAEPSNCTLVVNADDFGASRGINRGVIETFTNGVLTSASLMVTGRAVAEAVELARDHPDLGIGLHWDVIGEDERSFDFTNPAAVRAEYERQIERFQNLLGRNPTHVDSHRNLHMQPGVFDLFKALVEPLGVPLRGDGRVHHIGDFYAQHEWRRSNLEHVSVPYLLEILESELKPGWNEIGCHPGYPSGDFRSVYLSEREHEIDTLLDPTVRQAIAAKNIQLASFAELTG